MPSCVVGGVDAAGPIAARVAARHPPEVEPGDAGALLDGLEPAAAGLTRHRCELPVPDRSRLPSIQSWRSHRVTSPVAPRRLTRQPRVSAGGRRRFGVERDAVGLRSRYRGPGRPIPSLCDSTGGMEPLQIIGLSMIVGVILIVAWGRQHRDPD